MTLTVHRLLPVVRLPITPTHSPQKIPGYPQSPRHHMGTTTPQSLEIRMLKIRPRIILPGPKILLRHLKKSSQRNRKRLRSKSGNLKVCLRPLIKQRRLFSWLFPSRRLLFLGIFTPLFPTQWKLSVFSPAARSRVSSGICRDMHVYGARKYRRCTNLSIIARFNRITCTSITID